MKKKLFIVTGRIVRTYGRNRDLHALHSVDVREFTLIDWAESESEAQMRVEEYFRGLGDLLVETSTWKISPAMDLAGCAYEMSAEHGIKRLEPLKSAGRANTA